MTITILDSASLIRSCPAMDVLNNLGVVETWEESTLDELLDRCRYSTAVITRNTPLRREVLDYLTAIKYVGIIGDNADIVECRIAEALGIEVFFSPAPGICARLREVVRRLPGANAAEPSTSSPD